MNTVREGVKLVTVALRKFVAIIRRDNREDWLTVRNYRFFPPPTPLRRKAVYGNEKL
jgi:hypothetical protein